MSIETLHTDHAPKAIGPYAQAVRANGFLFTAGQIPLDPVTGQLVTGDIELEIRRVFDNLKAVAAAAGGSLAHAVRVTIYLTDLGNFGKVNEIMAQVLPQPWPSRVTVGVSQLPRGARVEIDCILHLD